MTTVNHSTQFIRVETGEYPITLNQIRRAHTNVSIAQHPTETSLRALGYEVVHSSQRPQGDVVTQSTPVLEEGRWVQSWEVREFNETEKQTRFNERRAELRNKVNEELQRALENGAPMELSGEIQHIQLRDADRANFAGLRLKANELKDAQVTEAVLPFRTRENIVNFLTPEQMIALSDFAFEAYTAMMSQAWMQKDMIDLAETLEDLPEYIEPIVYELPQEEEESGDPEGEEPEDPVEPEDEE